MNRFKKIMLPASVAAFLLAFCCAGFAAEMLPVTEQAGLKIFYTEGDNAGWDAVLKGKILSIGTSTENNKDDLNDYARSKSQVTVRLYDQYGVRAGDTLFVINSRNLIVSRIKVNSIFRSDTFGFLLIGYGNFLLANDGDRVVQRVESSQSRYSPIFKARGDYYDAVGESGSAINSYKKAIELDSGNPSARLALGYVYFKDNMYQFAMAEFSEAYKRITQLYDNDDRFSLLMGMTEVRFREAYYGNITDSLRKKYINEGIRYSSEALEINPDSKDANYYLGVFCYKNSEPDYVRAKNQFLKVIELDPDHVNAYVALAELYYKHQNKSKAGYYAGIALRKDPANERAKFYLELSE